MCEISIQKPKPTTLRKIFIIFVIILSSQIISAQVFTKKTERHKFELGINSPYYFTYYTKSQLGTFYYHDYIIQPNLSYYPVHYWGVGLSTDINIIKKSNFTQIPKKYGIGAFTRFYLPFKFTPRFFNRLDFFIEFKLDKTNYHLQEEILTEFQEPAAVTGLGFSEPIVSKGLTQTLFSIPIGIKYEVAGNLHFEFSTVLVRDLTNYEEYLDVRISAEYYFLSNRKRLKQKKQNNKNTDFLNSFIIGGSVMHYYSGKYSTQTSGNYYYSYNLWNFNVATTINKSMYLGIQNFMIFSNNADDEKSMTHLTGIFSQFDILRLKNNKRLFIDLSVNRGNILFDWNKGPVVKEKMTYAGVGLGLEFPLKRISKHIFFDLAAYRYPMLTNKNLGYAFNQLVIGLNYHFGKRVK